MRPPRLRVGLWIRQRPEVASGEETLAKHESSARPGRRTPNGVIFLVAWCVVSVPNVSRAHCRFRLSKVGCWRRRSCRSLTGRITISASRSSCPTTRCRGRARAVYSDRVKSNTRPLTKTQMEDPPRLDPFMAITKYSVDDYEEMVRLGLLIERDRVELIRGEIVPKMAIGPQHSTCVKGLNRLFILQAAGRAIVGCQDPVRLPDSEPEPDISVVRAPKERYLSGHPEPADIFLIVEVADSSLEDDQNIMKPLYAESGIQEFWIVNLRHDCLEVYRGPRADGTYQEMRVLKRGENIDIAALPGIVVAVDDVLG